MTRVRKASWCGLHCHGKWLAATILGDLTIRQPRCWVGDLSVWYRRCLVSQVSGIAGARQRGGSTTQAVGDASGPSRFCARKPKHGPRRSVDAGGGCKVSVESKGDGALGSSCSVVTTNCGPIPAAVSPPSPACRPLHTAVPTCAPDPAPRSIALLPHADPNSSRTPTPSPPHPIPAPTSPPRNLNSTTPPPHANPTQSDGSDDNQ